MKTKFFLVIILLMNICHSQPKKWTVMVYLNADNNLERFGIQDFLEMASVKDSDDVNVLVQMDRTPEEVNDYGNWTETLRFKIAENMTPEREYAIANLGEQNMGNPQVLRDFIKWCKSDYPAENYILIIWDHGDGWRFKEMKNLDDKTKALYIKDYKDFLITSLEIEKFEDAIKVGELKAQIASLESNKNTLAYALNTTATKFTSLSDNLKIKVDEKTNFTQLESTYAKFLNSNINKIPATQFSLIEEYYSVVNDLTTSESNIQTYNEQIKKLANKKYVVPEGFADNLQIGTVETEPVKAVSHDDTSGDMLYNKEIQDTLTANEVHIIGFDACLMSMLETAYALREKTGFIIGSEELEPGDGWNYELWLTQLIGNPSMKPVELNKCIVSSFEENYKNFKGVTLSSLNVTLIKTLSEQINELSKLLRLNINTEFQNIYNSRKLCQKYASGYTNIQSIDLKLFLYHLSKKTNDLNIKNLCEQAAKLIEAMITDNYKSKDMNFKQDLPSYGSFGIAIYFPLRKEYFDPAYTDTNTIYPVQFVKDFEWDNFLQAYFKLVK